MLFEVFLLVRLHKLQPRNFCSLNINPCKHHCQRPKINLLKLCVSSASEEQHVSIGVLDLKSPQTIIAVVVFEWCKKLDITGRKFCRQCNRIWNMKIGVPAGNAFFDISRVIRYGIDTNVLQDNHRSTSLDNSEEDVVVAGALKRDIEPETVMIKRQRQGNILYYEEWCNAGNFCFGQLSFQFFELSKMPNSISHNVRTSAVLIFFVTAARTDVE